MAEIVHRNLELMLPELEELERSGIFSPEEIKEVVRRRRNMEYKLQRRPARKEDFLRAIQYELSLDLLRKKRKKRLGVTSTRRDAEFGIGNRIHSIFKRAVKKFKADLKLWLQYIDFCQNSHHRISLGRVLSRALALHPNTPGLWVMGAKFQFEELNDPSSARSLMQQGLRSNSDSTHLWIEYFRLELMHVEKMKKRRQVLGLDKTEDKEVASLSEDFLSYKTASIVYQQAVKTLPNDLTLRTSFLSIYQTIEGTQYRQDEVYKSILQDFPTHSQCWDILARRHWVNVNTATLNDGEVADLERTSEEVYRDGLSRVEEPRSLWAEFLKWSAERLRDPHLHDSGRMRAIQRLLSDYREAEQRGHTTEAIVEQQLLVLTELGLEEEVPRVLSSALLSHPHSLSLWMRRLEWEGTKVEEEEKEEEMEVKNSGVSRPEAVSKLCQEALEKVPKKHSLPVWQFWLEHTISCNSKQESVENLFQRAIATTSGRNSETLSTLYIDWAAEVGGIKLARKAYKKLLCDTTVSYGVFRKCVEVEENVDVPSVKRLRELYDKTVSEYGSSNSDVWLDYIKLEMSQLSGDPTRVSQLHWRAMKSLRGDLAEEFVTKYTLLQLNS